MARIELPLTDGDMERARWEYGDNLANGRTLSPAPAPCTHPDEWFAAPRAAGCQANEISRRDEQGNDFFVITPCFALPRQGQVRSGDSSENVAGWAPSRLSGAAPKCPRDTGRATTLLVIYHLRLTQELLKKSRI